VADVAHKSTSPLITMRPKIQQWYIYSVAVVLFITSVAKLIAATGYVQMLSYPDPIIPLTNKQLFRLTSVMELMLSAFLLMKSNWRRLKLLAIAWLAIAFMSYRLLLLWYDYPNLSDCLGNINDTIAISPRVLTPLMIALSLWLLVGSSLFLILDYIPKTILSSKTDK
jgi:hypothetical protein